MKVEKNIFNLSPNNYHLTPELIIKKRVILTETKKNNNEDFINYLNNFLYKTPHYIITRDGSVIELINPSKFSSIYYTEYNDEFNYENIIIALENSGYLTEETNEFNDKLTYTNCYGDNFISKKDIFRQMYRNELYWHKYNLKQINATINFCKELILDDRYDITNNAMEHLLINDKINNYSGILFESNLSDVYKAPNPSFDVEKLYNQIKNMS
jgi:hypothetical protein